METCARCHQPMTCGHTLTLDACRKTWRLCCLCTGELTTTLDRQPAPA